MTGPRQGGLRHEVRLADVDPPPPGAPADAVPPDIAVPEVPPEASVPPQQERPDDARPGGDVPATPTQDTPTEDTPTESASPPITPEPVWEGVFRPFRVGDPGRAAAAPSYPARGNWDIADTVLDGVRLRNTDGRPVIELRAASARGRAHRFNAEVRQDAYAYRCDGRFVVAAVADGVSSGGLSHLAADIVCRYGCDLIAKTLATEPPEALEWDQILETLADTVLDVGRCALRPSRPDADLLTLDAIAEHLSTTALFAVLDMRSGDGFHAIRLLAHGDSSAWILRAGDGWEPLQAIKNADAVIASSGTAALPFLPPDPVVPVAARLGAGDTLVLVSDGVGDPLGDGTGSVGTFLAEKWQRPPQPLEFAAHVDFARKSFDDDRTALALWPIVSRDSISFT